MAIPNLSGIGPEQDEDQFVHFPAVPADGDDDDQQGGVTEPESPPAFFTPADHGYREIDHDGDHGVASGNKNLFLEIPVLKFDDGDGGDEHEVFDPAVYEESVYEESGDDLQHRGSEWPHKEYHEATDNHLSYEDPYDRAVVNTG